DRDLEPPCQPPSVSGHARGRNRTRDSHGQIVVRPLRALNRMTPSPQIERLTCRVATNTAPLPGAAPRRQVPGQRATGTNHRAVNPLVRGAFYVFIFSLLFEWPDRPIPMEIPTLIGFIYLAFTLLQPKVCYRQLPKEFCFFAAYVLFFSLLCGFVRHQDDAIR